MADNFDMKKFLIENKLGAYSKLKNTSIAESAGDPPISQMSREEMIDFLGTTAEKVKDMSDEELRDAVEDKNSDLREEKPVEEASKNDYDSLLSKLFTIQKKYGYKKARPDQEEYDNVRITPSAERVGSKIIKDGGISVSIESKVSKAAFTDIKNLLQTKFSDWKIDPQSVTKDDDFDTDSKNVLFFDIVKNKSVKEDMGKDIEDAEAAKMMDFLAEKPVKEVKRLRPKEYYQILDNGTGEWNDGFKYIGDIDGGSTVGEIGDHMFMAPTGPDAFIFVNISDADLDTMVRYDMNENKKPVEEAGQGTLMIVDRIEEIVNNLARNISTNSNISTQEKLGLVQALKELKDLVEDLGADVEMGMDETKKEKVSKLNENLTPLHKQLIKNIVDNYFDGGIDADPAMERIERILNDDLSWEELDSEDLQDLKEESVRMFKSDNPEGDKLVLGFLKRIAKDFNYPVSQAAMFVKERIKKLGY